MPLFDVILAKVGLVRRSVVRQYDDAMRLEGGAAKRLDEHRELAQLLMAKAPQLLSDHFWITGWLQSQDRYLDHLHRVAARRGLVAPRWSKTLRDRPSYRSIPGHRT
jgi:hypothetical protein